MQSQLQTHTSGEVRVPWNERTLPMAKKPETQTVRIGRDAETGQFKPVEDARRDREGSIVETIKRPVKK